MCKHSKDGVDKLAKRQRGLDARGNDPMATKRESSWAAEFVQNPPGDVLTSTLTYLNDLPEKIGNRNIIGTPEFKKKLQTLGDQPTGVQFATFFADQKTGFKGLMDEIGLPIQNNFPELDAKARDQPFFTDIGRNAGSKRGRNAGGLPRNRRQSMTNRHLGITTSMDRTTDTEDVYNTDVNHAKAEFLARLDDETVKKFQKSGAPFIAGASGTIQFIAMEMETRKPFEQLQPDELKEREKVLAMMSVQHVAAGHHSMTECLLGAKPYGYFKNVPDPLTDYDGAMRAFEKHLQDLGLGGGKEPLSRKSENQGKSKNEIKYEDRLAFVKTLRERYEDQLPPTELQKIRQRMADAANEADLGKHGQALKTLAKAENLIRAQAALIEANARGNNNVLRPDELEAKMRATPKVWKGASTEYKAVKEALADYEKQMKALAGRKLDHDRVALAFEVLRAELATVEKAAQAYKTKLESNPGKVGLSDVIDDLVAKIATEKRLLEEAERESNNYNLLGDVTIEQAIEYARFGVKPGTQVQPNVLKESRIANKKVLGSGGISTVMLIDYEADGANQGEQRAFKPERQEITTHTDMLNDLGIDPKKPRFGKRNIASKKMANAAGLGNLIPDATFTTVDGKVGLAMQKAGGEAPIKRVKVDVANPEDHPDLQDAYDARGSDANWKSKIPAKNSRGMRYGYDDQTGKFTVEKLRASEFPLTAPPAQPTQVAAVQQQLVNLQWLDAICGQTDRHAENYMIDTQQDPPVIMGIDNDFSFGKNRGTEQKSQNTLGLPPIVDKATFDKLMKMVQDWPQISQTLGDELDTEEIVATKARLDAVRDKLNELEQNGMVVQNWDQQVKGRSITDILMDPTSGQTYYKRDAEYQQFVKDSG